MNRVFTIGHSTRLIEEFIELLHDAGVDLLVDVRRFPMSRRYPHFNREALAAALRNAGIEYRHEEVLGGRRRPAAGSPNTAWRNEQFRGYADHMDTAPYQAALKRVMDDARERVQAVMCAEAVSWRCHRNLLADALVARGVEVQHILELGKRNVHKLHAEAQVLTGGRLIYGPRVDQTELL